MSKSEALPTAPEFESPPGDGTISLVDPTGSDPADDHQADAAEELARSQRIGAWVEAGATSLPALLIALGSAAVGGVALGVRRRRRR